jgi:hypothetical protein
MRDVDLDFYPPWIDGFFAGVEVDMFNERMKKSWNQVLTRTLLKRKLRLVKYK